MARVKRRADLLLVEQGIAESRTRAQSLIMAGEVVVLLPGGEERRVDKAGEQLPPEASLRLKGQGLRYVSRGGLKLEAALDAFRLDVSGARALDLGASTGGFTDCLLQRGARHVTAVDVGRGQLHERLRTDPRVTSLEKTNVKALPLELGAFDVVVGDLSFISIVRVLPFITPHVAPGGLVVLLIKPQFECGREAVEKGGVVRDPAAREEAVTAALQALTAQGFQTIGAIESPVHGPAGNIESLVAARRRID